MRKRKTTGKIGNARKPLRLHSAIARDLGKRIVSGRVRPGQLLDGEIEASEQRRVSRTAYREAVRMLAAKGLVHSRPRIGTRVNLIDSWQLLDPDVLAWVFEDDPSPDVLRALFELRRIVEPAAAALAAARRERKHLDAMRRALDDMERHTLHAQAGRAADQEFHATLLQATGNPFIVSLTNGITAAVAALTEFKQRAKPLKRDPVPDHRRILDAIVAKDSERARATMSELIRRATHDTPMKLRAVGARHGNPGRAGL